VSRRRPGASSPAASRPWRRSPSPSRCAGCTCTYLHARAAATGNDHALVGLWHFGIPTLSVRPSLARFLSRGDAAAGAAGRPPGAVLWCCASPMPGCSTLRRYFLIADAPQAPIPPRHAAARIRARRFICTRCRRASWASPAALARPAAQRRSRRSPTAPRPARSGAGHGPRRRR
jgi:hypothetical protein